MVDNCTNSPFLRVSGHTVYAPALMHGPRVLDIGANRGRFSQRAKEVFAGAYWLYEPNPTLFEDLTKSSEWHHVYNKACAGAAGISRFHLAVNDEGSSLLPLPAVSRFGCTLQAVTHVPCDTLDVMVDSIGAPVVDLVKMDIEGAETDVLLKCHGHTLQKIGQLTVEFHCANDFGFDIRADVAAVIRRMKRNGFWCIDFSYPERTDVLFVNLSLRPISQLRRTILKLRYATGPRLWCRVCGRVRQGVLLWR